VTTSARNDSASAEFDDHDIEIRPARPEDLNNLTQLDAAAFGDLAYPPFVLRQLFDVYIDCWLVANHPSGLLGYALPAVSPMRNDEGWLLALAVHDDARGHGVGRRLVQASLDILRSLGVTATWLTVEPDNIPAIALYRSMGFTAKELRQDYLGPGEHRLVMKLTL
jgi:ribosomal-protein-alanine N-acetyltransferase